MRASLQGRRRSVLAEHIGPRAFWLWFAIPAVLTAVYATVLSSQIVAWQTATAYWILTILLIWLISWLASIVARCEESVEHDSPAAGHRSNELDRAVLAERRLAHLEQIVIRQHRFVADAAHELRTPLTGLTLIGENVLAKKDIPASQLRETIASMLEESEHMKRLIEGLLELTRASLASAANHDGRRSPFALDLGALARDCVETLQILAEEKQQCIELSVPGKLWANSDLTLVRQALLNVIHNAIEHCPPGAHIRVETGRHLPDQALIRVQDDGPGIPEEEQRDVFERFYRGSGTSRARGGIAVREREPKSNSEDSTRPRRRGLGLGLSIAKAILCSQGGGIELRSRPGAGSCFILSLPLLSDVPRERAQTPTHEPFLEAVRGITAP